MKVAKLNKEEKEKVDLIYIKSNFEVIKK